MRGGGGEELSQLFVLFADCHTTFTDTVVVLSAVEHTGELKVDFFDVLGEMETTVCEIGGEIFGECFATGEDVGGCVVHGVVGGDVVFFPTAVALVTFLTNFVGGAVENDCYIVLVGGGAEGGF